MKCPTCQFVNTADSNFCKECGARLALGAATPGQAAESGAGRAAGPAAGHPPSPAERASFTKTLETSTDELSRGTLFAGRYEVIEELGAGGMGRVYRVHDTKLNEEVALKLIRPEIGADKRTVERFHNEIKIARKIGHRNVCRTYDLHEEGRTLYLTMEYVRGEDLKSFIKRSKVLSVGTAVSIAHQVAEGLAEAHKLGIVHRDLKPGNIMIDKEGQAKIMDFGIARAMREKGITGAGAIVGTPEYMSPEQVEGKEADQRADIYALGVILFEMVTGQVPFEGDTPFSIANKHKSEPPPIPRKLAPQMPEALNKLILRSLEKDKAKRYQTAEELLEDLAMVEGALPTAERISALAKPKPSREITVKLTPKKLLIPAASLIVLTVTAILLWHPSSHKKNLIASSGKPSLAVLPFENYSGDSRLENWRYGFPMLIITGLSSSKYLNVLRLDEVNGVLQKLNLAEGKALISGNIKKIAEEAEVSSLLTASFVKAGENFIITANLVNGQTGETQATLSLKPQSIENILGKGGGLDGLVKDIKQRLNITQEQMASDIDVEIGKVMTRNPEALICYFEGERLHLDFRQDKAIVSLEKAVELDPEFAMAHWLLGVVYEGMGQYAKSRESQERAFRLKDRMPPREYFILQGDYYWQSESTYPKAIEMYKEVLEIYPDDHLGNHLLAVTYGILGQYSLAIEQYSKILKGRPRDLKFYANVAGYYSRLGEKEKATQTMKEFVANHPGDDLGHYDLSLCYIVQRRFDLYLQEIDQAIAVCPDNARVWTKLMYTTAAKGDYYFFRDDLEEAARFYRNFLDNAKSDQEKTAAVEDLNDVDILKGRPEEVLMRLKSYQTLFEKTAPDSFHFSRGKAYIASQMPGPAVEEFKKACALVPESQVPRKRAGYFWEAVAQLEQGNLAEAEKLSGEIDRLTPELMRKAEGHFALYLRGRLALGRKNLPDALKLLDEAVANCPGEYPFGYGQMNALFLDTLASACLASRDVDNAFKNYEKITLLTVAREDRGDLYARSYYNLGKIYEEKGLKNKAAENYEKFISLWKDCEARFRPLVEDAREPLAGLKGS